MPWRRSYGFVARPSRLGSSIHGQSVVYRPMLPVRVVFDRTAVRAEALVDSGADFSYMPYDVANTMLGPAIAAGGQEEVISGIGGALKARVFEFEVTLLDPVEPKTMLVPFLVPTSSDLRELAGQKVSPPVVIGRHPFFSRFKVEFDLGETPSEGRSVWALEEISSRG